MTGGSKDLNSFWIFIGYSTTTSSILGFSSIINISKFSRFIKPFSLACVKNSRRGLKKPVIGDTRIKSVTGYDWKAHHRETNNLMGIFWDFIKGVPMITALFYSPDLNQNDWGNIIQPRENGGRTTSV